MNEGPSLVWFQCHAGHDASTAVHVSVDDALDGLDGSLMKIAKTGAAVTLSLGLAMGAGVLPASATAGDNDPRDCTAREYRAVKRGMGKDRVARILDGKGRQQSAYIIGGDRYESRKYGAGLSNGWCLIDYKNGRVTGKFRIA